MGCNRRVEIDGLKQTGLNRRDKTHWSKQTCPNILVQTDWFKKLGLTYRSKKTGSNKGVQIKTEMSPKLKCPKLKFDNN